MSAWDESTKLLSDVDNGVRIFSVDQMIAIAQVRATLAIGEEMRLTRLRSNWQPSTLTAID